MKRPDRLSCTWCSKPLEPSTEIGWPSRLASLKAPVTAVPVALVAAGTTAVT